MTPDLDKKEEIKKEEIEDKEKEKIEMQEPTPRIEPPENVRKKSVRVVPKASTNSLQA